ncbi:MAG TPA: 1,4-dihydroxy-2-naphthoate polyprenyltransferase [Baekduia sp.]|nr:1,4-dihydroxy-2-naphthoate polyprenyltransferase [Baekduia sp.]
MRIWLLAARPRTLPAAVAPVLVGTAYAAGLTDHLRWGPFIAALLGAIFIQIGTNLSNDYSDARRGADTEDRLGPVRVTAGGLVPPASVLRATYIAFGLAVVCGAYLVYIAGPVILAIGAASIVAGVLYTGGPRPYGYEGLGEVFVFLFFGVVAVTGSAFVQLEEFDGEALLLSIPVGFLATAILVVNNVRDINTDARAGKRTLAVRMGRERTRVLFMTLVAGSFVLLAVLAVTVTVWVLIAFAAVIPAVPLIAKVRSHADGPTLNAALAETGKLQLIFCVLLAAGLLLA